MAADNFSKLKRLLEELFQLDQADLDFGIYRIMNTKRDEVVRFLDQDLLPQVKEAFGEYQSADTAEIRRELDKLVASVTAAGMNPEDSPKVQELREKLQNEGVDVVALENDVYSHLFSFFRRYYNEGDFISLRRYKEGVYAIPYEGEEVKLHWANHDQYYIKSSEYLRDYVFKLSSGKRVRVHLVSASTEQDNKKEAQGKERRFVLADEDPLYEENGELYIRFEYRPDDGSKKQAELNKAAIEAILEKGSSAEFRDWINELTKPAPTAKDSGRTVLERHLSRYTARNTFDYFIHKDLGSFLRRELDFYIKNEVMHLDDIENESAARVEQYLSKIKVLRRIAHKIILFLEQLENFQKKLWLKKKFVVESSYCITLDRIPESLYEEIAANDAQREEWVKLFAIDEITGCELGEVAYSEPLSKKFLLANRLLPVDTKFFDSRFKDDLLKGISDIDGETSFLMVNSENQNAMSFLKARYSGKVDSIYADPPYNTDGSPILYKNGFKNSTWVTLILDRLTSAKKLLSETGVLCATIDDFQQKELHFAIETAFSPDSIAGTVVVRSNPSGRPIPSGFGIAHEYAIFATQSESGVIAKLPREEAHLKRYKERDDRGRFMWELFRKRGSGSRREDRRTMYYPLYASGENVRVPEMKWDESKKEWIPLEGPGKDEQVLYPIDSDGMERRWRWKHESVSRDYSQFKVATNREGETIVYYKYRPSQDGVIPLTVWADPKYSATEHGTGILKKLFKEYNVFDFPKSVFAVEDCLMVAALPENGICLDCFGGSGTTGHAVANLNRKDGGSRKCILIEMGDHYETVLKPRVQKVMYSDEWADGKPLKRDAGLSFCAKCIRLETYEDALNNLEMQRTVDQSELLSIDADLREQYLLSYMLDVESRANQSLLNFDSFQNPNSYKLKIERDGETQLVEIDLLETFNWLLGLTVKQIDRIRGIRVVEGTNPDGERVLVLWRNLDETDNDALDAWFKKQGYNTKDQDYDAIYVNGDNNLENLRRADQTWKVRLTEEHFHRLMFEDCDS